MWTCVCVCVCVCVLKTFQVDDLIWEQKVVSCEAAEVWRRKKVDRRKLQWLTSCFSFVFMLDTADLFVCVYVCPAVIFTVQLHSYFQCFFFLYVYCNSWLSSASFLLFSRCVSQCFIFSLSDSLTLSLKSLSHWTCEEHSWYLCCFNLNIVLALW